MHPLVLRPAGADRARPLLTVPGPDDDRNRFGSCTHCGRTEPDGEAACTVLAEELQMLEALSGRRFVPVG